MESGTTLRIALVQGIAPGDLPDVQDELDGLALESWFRCHEVKRFWLRSPVPQSSLAALDQYGAIIPFGRNLLGVSGSPRPQISLGEFQRLRRPVLPVGLDLPQGLERLSHESQRLLEHWAGACGRLSVASPRAFHAVHGVLGHSRLTLTGPLQGSLTGHGVPGDHELRLLVADGPVAPHGHKVQRLLSDLGEGWTFLPTDPSWLVSAVEPGLPTLALFRNADLLLRAVCSSRAVVSASIPLAMLARNNGVPAIVLSQDTWSRLWGEELGLPVLPVERAHPDVIDRIIEESDWESVASAGALERHLGQFALSVSSPPTSQQKQCGKSALSICVIANQPYLHSTMALVRNLQEVTGSSLDVHLLALDDHVRHHAAQAFPGHDVTTYRLEDLWEETELREIEQRPPALQAYSSKARLLTRALACAKRPVFYLDSDMHFLKSPLPLFEELRRGPVLVFPQWNRDPGKTRSHGLFNAGMVGAAPGAEKFLSLWAHLCLHRCHYDEGAGYYVDQGFLDLAPVYFPDTVIYRGKDHNVAPWNLQPLGVSGPAPCLKDGKPVASLHAAFLDPDGVMELKFGWDQLVARCSGLDPDGEPQLQRNILEQQSRYWLTLGRFLYLSRLIRPLGVRRRALRVWVTGGGRFVLALLAWIHRPLRWVQQQSPKRRTRATTEKREWQFWSRLQQRVLFANASSEIPVERDASDSAVT